MVRLSNDQLAPFVFYTKKVTSPGETNGTGWTGKGSRFESTGPLIPELRTMLFSPVPPFLPLSLVSPISSPMKAIDGFPWDRYKGVEYKGSYRVPFRKIGKQCRFPPAAREIVRYGQWRPPVPTG